MSELQVDTGCIHPHPRLSSGTGRGGVMCVANRCDLRFHWQMATGCIIFTAASLVGCVVTSANIEHPLTTLCGLGMGLAMVAPLPLYWQEKGRAELRDAALTIPWALVLAVVLPLPVAVGARIASPLQDVHLAQLDRLLGANVPGVMAWAAHSWLGRCINWSYPLLNPLLAVTAIVPALAGRAMPAKRFLLANLIAFFIGVPLFALLPAVGPWYGYHLSATHAQIGCQADLLALRVHGPYAIHPSGIVCFPSFHVIWAILCASALWTFRCMRVPIAILAAMIIFSTMTTGWHYFSDVLAGLLIALISMLLSRRVCQPINR